VWGLIVADAAVLSTVSPASRFCPPPTALQPVVPARHRLSTAVLTAGNRLCHRRGFHERRPQAHPCHPPTRTPQTSADDWVPGPRGCQRSRKTWVSAGCAIGRSRPDPPAPSQGPDGARDPASGSASWCPTYRSVHDPFKTASGVHNSGPWDPWLPAVENSRLFTQRMVCPQNGVVGAHREKAQAAKPLRIEARMAISAEVPVTAVTELNLFA